MFAYKISNYNYDNTIDFIVLHENKFTKEEYENIINNCRKKLEEQLKINKQIIENDDYLTDDQAEKLFYLSHEDDIPKNIYELLLKEYGFKKIRIEYNFVLNDEINKIVKNRVIDNN